MKLSVELTLYPLQDNYIDIIRACIEKIHSFEGLSINTFPTATIVVGDYDNVMKMLNDVIAWSYTEFGKCVFIAKFLPGYEAR
ncbi:hypothetical protein TDB9533_01505 [Thalassocella blandensis]|nr:hypothetical protein TDB9533_01505 [Thalassocella blandensis]